MAIGNKKIEDYLPVVKYNEGIRTAYDIRTSGDLTVEGNSSLTGNQSFGGSLDVTGATTLSSTLSVSGASSLSGAVNYKRQVTDTGGAFATPVVLTVAQSGRVILCDDAAGLDFTLPTIAAADIGTHFKFVVTVAPTSNSYRMTAATGDLLFGGFWIADFDTANTGAYFKADGTDDLVLTLNGSTTGGKVGTVVDFIATSATQWFVSGNVFGDGSLATPFS